MAQRNLFAFRRREISTTGINLPSKGNTIRIKRKRRDETSDLYGFM